MMEGLREYFSTWWSWVLVLALLSLIGVFIYIRTRPKDD